MTNPTLRFPGNFADWKARKLGEITCHIRNGAFYDASCKSGSCMMTRIETISSGKINEAKVGYAEGIGEKYRLLFGDILYSHINSLSSLGKTAIYKNVPYKIYHGMNLLSIRADKNIVDPDFLFISLNLKKSTDWALSHSKRAINQCSISASDIAGMDVKLPSVVEQQKIASFFTALDEKISISERRLSCLKKLKKGVMQNIFSQKIRFKRENGINFEDWSLKTIGSIGQISTGSTPKTSNEEYFGGQYLWVTPTDILGKEISYTARTLTEAGMAVSRRIPANSILVTCIASIGKNCILRTTGSCNQQINSITPNEFFDPDFVYYAMCKNEQVLHANAGHGGMEILNKSDFSNIEILFPCKDEQKKISAYLTTLDDKIAIVEKRLLSLHLLKKSFMQQMFI